jgi:hypothetical protein
MNVKTGMLVEIKVVSTRFEIKNIVIQLGVNHADKIIEAIFDEDDNINTNLNAQSV